MKPSIFLSQRVFFALALTASTCSLAFAAPALPPQIEQLAITKNAAPLADRKLSASLGELLTKFGEERKLPLSDVKAAQIWTWSGAHYKSGRAAFWRSSLQKSLEGAGYAYHEFDNHEVATNIYEQQFGLAAYDDDGADHLFSLQTGDEFNFFTAVNRDNGQAFDGVWVEFKDAEKILLAVLPLGAQAVKAPVKLPPVAGANVVLVKDPNDVMKGVTPPKNPAFAPRAAKKGYASGQVKDLSGKPLAGATISVNSSAVGGFRTSVTTQTNAQGVYSVALPVGICQVIEAYYRASYNGKPLFLPLRAADGKRETFPSQNGHVENFVLRTWGVADADGAATNPKEGAHYFGASVRVQWFHDKFPEDGTVEVTLKPQGALLGGGTGRTFVLRFPIVGDEVLMSDHFINNLPIGRYQVTAQVLADGESLPLKIENTFGDTKSVSALTIDFKSFGNDYASQDHSGIEQYQIMLKP